MTAAHLRQTATPDARVKLALRDALESEAEFVEAENADEQLLALLRKLPSRTSFPGKQGPDEQDQRQSPTTQNQKPGKRAPGRDAMGVKSEEETPQEQKDEKRAAG